MSGSTGWGDRRARVGFRTATDLPPPGRREISDVPQASKTDTFGGAAPAGQLASAAAPALLCCRRPLVVIDRRAVCSHVSGEGVDHPPGGWSSGGGARGVAPCIRSRTTPPAGSAARIAGLGDADVSRLAADLVLP